MTRRAIASEALSLPVEERAQLVEVLLRSLNAPDPDLDRQWIEVSRHRLAELRAGAVQAVPADAVFAKVRDRFKQ